MKKILVYIYIRTNKHTYSDTYLYIKNLFSLTFTPEFEKKKHLIASFFKIFSVNLQKK